MTKYFSYIDTALRIIYINKTSDIVESEKKRISDFLANADTSSHVKMEMLQRMLEAQLKENPKIMEAVIHEFHHYLQSLFYPCLYYLNWLEFDNLMQLRQQLKSSEEASYVIKDIRMNGKFAVNYLYTSYRFQLYWENDQLRMTDWTPKSPENQVFSLNDLLEDVTSLFQYKLITQNPNHEDYYNWIKNPANRCYKRLYLFMVKQVGKKHTYDLLPILVQAGFSTSEPIGGFCNSVTFINYHLANYEDFTSGEIFKKIMDWLKEKLGEVDIDLTQMDNITETPVKVLSHESIRQVIDFGRNSNDLMHYPLAVHASKFRGELKNNPELLHYLFSIDREKFNYLEREFQPIAIRYYFLDMKGRDSMLMFGKEFREQHTPDKIPYSFYIREIMKVKEVTQAIFTRVQQHIPHNCHHEKCPYYEIGLCRNWNSIPAAHHNCGFPAWFSYVFRRKINLEALTLDKAAAETDQSSWNEYHQKAFKKRKFNYVKTEGGYTLSIGLKDFEQEEKKHMFRDFIHFLTQENGTPHASLAATISLDFYGFDDDLRPLFEIPSAKQWMLDTMQDTPEFLVYINFLGTVDHLFILIPAFVKHKVISPDTKNFGISMDATAHKQFLIEQMLVVSDFKRKHPTANQELLLQNFSKLFNGNQN